MRRFAPFLLAAMSLLIPLRAADAAEGRRPNFLVIVADDLGFSDLGAFGGDIDTPNLDALALSGLRLTGFHSAPTCSPTRSMLLSGTDNHRAGLGSMAELIAPNQKGQPGYEGYLSPNVVSLAEILAANGYRTLQSGKWHLGLAPSQDPTARGFQHSFVLLQGAHNHFGNDISPDPSKGATYREDGKTLTSLPANFYSSDTFATKLIEQLEKTSKAAEGKKPFFAYLTFTAPHWPLQAPAETVAKYKGRYDAGFEALRAARLKRQVELGLLSPTAAAHAPVLRKGDWDALSPEEKRLAARDMEVYAGMVDRLDQNVGRVIAALKRLGQLENTVILFTADNGAEGMDFTTTELKSVRERQVGADNSLENRGNANSYIAYGPGWAQAATAPSWLYKAYSTEGGTRVAAFINAPQIARKGGIASAFGSVMDALPTFLDLAAIAQPAGEFQGRKVEPIRGKSWAAYLTDKADHVYNSNDAVGTELFGSRSIRQGDWKVTDLGDGQWRLFNVAEDSGETHDLAATEPDRFKELIARWDTYAKEVGVILPSQRLYRP